MDKIIRLSSQPYGDDFSGTDPLLRMKRWGKGTGGSGQRPGTRLPEAIAALFPSKGPV